MRLLALSLCFFLISESFLLAASFKELRSLYTPSYINSFPKQEQRLYQKVANKKATADLAIRDWLENPARNTDMILPEGKKPSEVSKDVLLRDKVHSGKLKEEKEELLRDIMLSVQANKVADADFSDPTRIYYLLKNRSGVSVADSKSHRVGMGFDLADIHDSKEVRKLHSSAKRLLSKNKTASTLLDSLVESDSRFAVSSFRGGNNGSRFFSKIPAQPSTRVPSSPVNPQSPETNPPPLLRKNILGGLGVEDGNGFEVADSVSVVVIDEAEGLRKELEKSRRLIEELHGIIDDKSKVIEKADSYIKHLAGSLDEKKNEVRVLRLNEGGIKAIPRQGRAEELAALREVAEANEKTIQYLGAEAKAYQKAYEAKETLLKQAEEQLAKKDDFWKQQLQVLEKDITTKHEELQRLNKQLGEVSQRGGVAVAKPVDLDAEVKEIESLKQNLAEAKARLEKEAGEFLQEKTALEADRRKIEQQIEPLMEQVRKLAGSSKWLEDQNTDLFKQVETQGIKLEESTQTIKELAHKNTHLESEAQRLNQELHKALHPQGENKASGQLDDLMKQLAEETKSREVWELGYKKQKAVLGSLAEGLKQPLGIGQWGQNWTQQIVDHAKQLSDKLAKLHRVEADALDTTSKANAMVAEASKKVTGLTDKARALEAKLVEAAGYLETATQEVVVLRELRDKVPALAAENEKLMKLRDKHASELQELTHLRAMQGSVEKTVSTQKSRIAQLTQGVAEREAELVKWKKVMPEWKKALETARSAEVQAKERADELAAHIAKLVEASKGKEGQLSQLAKRASNAEQVVRINHKLTKQLEEAISELDRLKKARQSRVEAVDTYVSESVTKPKGQKVSQVEGGGGYGGAYRSPQTRDALTLVLEDIAKHANEYFHGIKQDHLQVDAKRLRFYVSLSQVPRLLPQALQQNPDMYLDGISKKLSEAYRGLDIRTLPISQKSKGRLRSLEAKHDFSWSDIAEALLGEAINGEEYFQSVEKVAQRFNVDFEELRDFLGAEGASLFGNRQQRTGADKFVKQGLEKALRQKLESGLEQSFSSDFGSKGAQGVVDRWIGSQKGSTVDGRIKLILGAGERELSLGDRLQAGFNKLVEFYQAETPAAVSARQRQHAWK